MKFLYARSIMPVSVVVLLLIVATAMAFPGKISFQGILSDSEGTPLADSDYEVTFTLYSAAEGGTMLWQETQVVVTESGQFDVILGETTPIPSQLFMTYDYAEVYLEMQVGDEVLSPRTQLVAQPYAMVAGDLEGYSDNNGAISFRTDSDAHRFDMFDENEQAKIILDARPGGEIRLQGSDPTNPITAKLTSEATGFGGGAMQLWDDDGTGPNVSLFGGLDGDSAAMLPEDAINEVELLNEPGLANTQVDTGGISIPLGPSWGELARVTIHLPSDGYVFVSANTQLWVSSCPDEEGVPCDGSIMITLLDTIPDQQIPGSERRYVSLRDASDNLGYNIILSAQATYQKDAGTHTFYFVAQAPGISTIQQELQRPSITAMFFPTAYGIVETN